MKHIASVSLPLTLAAFAALALPAAAQDQEKWTFDVAPYLWIASVGAESSLPQVGAGTPTVQEFDTKISGGFMIAAQARYRSVGVLVDFNWLRLNTESLDPAPLYSAVNLRTDYIYTTAALTYDLPLKGRFHAQAVAGARIWYIASNFDAQSGVLPGFKSSNSDTWVDPLVGANLRFDLTRHWLLLARGTAGGFTDSTIQWDAFGGIGYQFSDWCMATIGYRYLHEEKTDGDFTFNADAQGCLLGVVFQF